MLVMASPSKLYKIYFLILVRYAKTPTNLMRLTKNNIISNSKVYERKYNVTYDLYAFIFAFYILNFYFLFYPKL